MPMLSLRDLHVEVAGAQAVSGVSMDLEEGGRYGLVGESGSGKTLTAMAVMGLLPQGARAWGLAMFGGTQDLLTLSEAQMCRVRGERISMVFQEPMTALNPVMRIGDQVAECIRLHRRTTRTAARARALELLELVHLPDPADKLRSYPHQLSGGQRQRVMMAMAIALEPDLIIADEPTTALDVSVQAQILALLAEVLTRSGATLLLITHDLPVVSVLCDTVMVMYGGHIVEQGSTATVFSAPRHPYTRGLLDAVPAAAQSGRLAAIPGSVPPLGHFPQGCVFRNRCSRETARCAEMPPLSGDAGGAVGHSFACWHPLEA